MGAADSRRLRDWLNDLALHGIKLGLDNIGALLKFAGNPELRYPTVHVGGTNGKGSVVAMLDAMLRAAGYRTGRFTSPHLITLNERFLLDGRPVSDGQLDQQLDYFRRATRDLGQTPTFFELNTAVAFRLFDEACVDVALVEVGMGGRFDSTNLIQPEAVCITNIDLEHTAYLGDTIEKIAFEKAGIIKPGVPVVFGEDRSAALGVIEAKAAETGSPLVVFGRDYTYAIAGHPWEQRLNFYCGDIRLENIALALAGRYQGANAAAALATAIQLQQRFPRLDRRAMVAGLSNARWPCRMHQVIGYPPIIIDVAHNVAGATRLAETLERAIVVLAVANDKDARGMINALAPITEQLLLTQFDGERGLKATALREMTEAKNIRVCESLEEAIELGMASAQAGLPLLITGSIFTAGQAYAYLMKHHGAPALRF